MTITNDHPESHVPWYMLRSSIMMIVATIITITGVAYDHVATDVAPPTGILLAENGKILNGRMIGLGGR